MPLWIAAFNHHTREWSTGGPLNEYPVEHWDRYVVTARSHDDAKDVARKLRSKQRTLPPGQRALLSGLLNEHNSLDPKDRGECPWVEISAEEVRAARALVAKGLLNAMGTDERQVMLTVPAFNRLQP